MEHVTAEDLQNMEPLFRRNLVNSSTGYKPANLLATRSPGGISNVAVFNSVFHLGSHPPLLGIVLRTKTAPRGIYENIRETGYFTVNHIQENMIEQAHQTTTQQGSEDPEFGIPGLDQEFLDDFYAPYVKQSSIKLGCKYLKEYSIQENGTIILVASIEHIYFEAGIEMPDGWLRLDDAGSVVINGLDGYALPSLLDRFQYARPGKEIKSFFKNAKL